MILKVKRKSWLLFLMQLFSLNCIHCWILNDINVSANALRDDDVDYGESDDILATNRIALIFPGTKWCGPGNVASTNEDLGVAVEPDKCCREHDNCPDLIPAGETKYNLTNDAYYSRLSCECDVKFRQCLHSTNSTVANKVGTIYFNVIGTQCYRQDYPIKGCKRKGGWFNKKCLEYEYDETGKPDYQWFDVPNY